MNWRVLVTTALLLAAALSGWSVWKQRARDEAPTAMAARSDYVLEEFELRQDSVVSTYAAASFSTRYSRP